MRIQTQNQPVVVCAGADRARRACWEDEPIFWTTHSHVTVKTSGTQRTQILDRLAQYLAHRIIRFPQDLPSHTHRILLHVHRRDGEAIWGALVDLFIALEDREPAYRAHTLDLARDLVPEDRLAKLRASLDGKLLDSDMLPPCQHSVLTKSYTGSNQLIVRHLVRAPVQRSVPEEAHDLIASERFPAAQDLLEQALLQDPGNETLAMELLDLYRYTGDRDSLTRMQQRLQRRSPQAAQTWAAIAAFFTTA